MHLAFILRAELQNTAVQTCGLLKTIVEDPGKLAIVSIVVVILAVCAVLLGLIALNMLRRIRKLRIGPVQIEDPDLTPPKG